MIPTAKIRKDVLIARILRNDTYMSDSGIIMGLTRRLLKLSLPDLRNLELILAIKSGSMKR